MPDCVAASVTLAPFTTLGVGGVATYLATITSIDELAATIRFAQSQDLPICVIGGGSNVLVSDAGFPGMVLHIRLLGMTFTVSGSSVYLSVGAGELLDTVVAESVAHGYWGLENLSHIPGTIGATPVQNVGAYGVEVSDLIDSVEVYDCAQGLVRTLSATECGFGYRDSVFKTEAGQQLIVTKVNFVLSTLPRPRISYGDLSVLQQASVLTPTMVREAVIGIRSKKFPDWHVIGTAGSFFKNPILPREFVAQLLCTYPDVPVYPYDANQQKISLGYVLDKICHLKGVRQGNVGLYEAQALVLVAYAPVTASEIDAFATFVTETVYSITAIRIEAEVRKIGF